jgi:isopentenyl-diphosphate delta-isomerase
MSSPAEHVVLVNPKDEEIGTSEKMKAHELGLLHRAFSVFLFNSRGEMLLHRRALGKYHSGGLWTNTCCSHPRPGESTEAAAGRRLREEMGLSAPLSFAFSFIYRAELDQGLIEHELDHVYIGESDAIPLPHPEEVESYAYVAVDELERDLISQPEKYTEWFKICVLEVLKRQKRGR